MVNMDIDSVDETALATLSMNILLLFYFDERPDITLYCSYILDTLPQASLYSYTIVNIVLYYSLALLHYFPHLDVKFF